MAARLLGLAVAAVAADAFLLPPSMSAASSVDKVEPDVSTWTLVDPNSQLLLVPCQGCKVDGSAGDSNLLLNLTVGTKPGTIELGGEVVYPVNVLSALHSNPSVLEVPSDASLADIQSDVSKYAANENILTGWMFGTTNEKISEDGDEILSVNLDITSIGSHHVNVPHVNFKILKNPENHMMILSSGVDDMAPATPDKEECTTRLCQFRQMIEDKLHGIAASFPKPKMGCAGEKGMKGVHGMEHDGSRPPVNMHHGHHGHHDGADRQPMYEHGPQHPHHGHHSHHHSKLHRFVHRFGKLFMAIVVPILIGIAAGVVTYIVGMVIGCGIAFLWIKFRRGGRRGYASVAADEDHLTIKELEIDVEPRESFESAPPTYEEAPAYEEKEPVA